MKDKKAALMVLDKIISMCDDASMDPFKAKRQAKMAEESPEEPEAVAIIAETDSAEGEEDDGLEDLLADYDERKRG